MEILDYDWPKAICDKAVARSPYNKTSCLTTFHMIENAIVDKSNELSLNYSMYFYVDGFVIIFQSLFTNID